MFLLQITYPDGTVVRGIPGIANPFERDLIAACTAAILARGASGMFRTEAQVRRAIEDGMTDALLELKKTARYARKEPPA